MSTAVSVKSRIATVDVTDEAIVAHLVDGRVISVPLAWSWRLSEATRKQRVNWQLTGEGFGVHWPDVDEDISAEGMLRGIPAPGPQRRPVRTQVAVRLKISEGRIMADHKTVKPGEKTKDSGIYEDKSGKKTTQVKGKTAPPTGGKGQKHEQDVDTNPKN